jgi:hypothetical protein
MTIAIRALLCGLLLVALGHTMTLQCKDVRIRFLDVK